MIYQLYRAVDRRDNTEALWLLRAPSGAHQMEEMAYLGKVQRPKDIGRHVSQIKRTTFAKPDFYVFESMYGWAMHCHHQTRHLIDQWESMVNWMLAAIKCIGVGWILLTFFIVLRSYISLVNGGKDPFSMLFGAAFTWVLIGIVPVAIAKMAWCFIN